MLFGIVYADQMRIMLLNIAILTILILITVIILPELDTCSRLKQLKHKIRETEKEMHGNYDQQSLLHWSCEAQRFYSMGR